MNQVREFIDKLSIRERSKFLRLDTPAKIQEYLDSINYCDDDTYHCPLQVITSGECCCFAGALFAANALRKIGHDPLILELVSERDDDHIIALYKHRGLWGALAKSHYTGLRARLPVYRTLRELVLSYFDNYYNLKREYTLRGYSAPVSLAQFDRLHWTTSDENIHAIANKLDTIRHISLFPKRIAKHFPKVDRQTYEKNKP